MDVVARQPDEPATATVPALRCSDQDRERAVEQINAAVADGRLTWAEHDERMALVLAARTRDDLAPHLADLGRTVVAAGRPQEVSARLSKIIRRAEPGRPVHAHSWFGAVYVDLTGVEPGSETHVDATSFGGKVVLTVPSDATVVDEGHAVLGKRKILGLGSPAPDGPVIRITGSSTIGHLRVVGDDPRFRSWWRH